MDGCAASQRPDLDATLNVFIRYSFLLAQNAIIGLLPVMAFCHCGYIHVH